jgi:phosphoglycolate phosphatase
MPRLGLDLRFFFDLDGPILDVSRRYFRVHSHIVRELGGTPGDEIAFWESKRARRSVTEILSVQGNTCVDVARYQKLWLERIESEEYLKSDQLQRDVLVDLESLLQEHRLCLVTLRRRPDLVRNQLERFGLNRLFEHVLIADPAIPFGWQTKSHLMRSVGAVADGNWIIGDTEVDIRAGKALGMTTVGVLCGIRDQVRLENDNPDFIIGGIGELKSLVSRVQT